MTGVQTCALPISTCSHSYSELSTSSTSSVGVDLFLLEFFGLAPRGCLVAVVKGVAVPCDVVSADNFEPVRAFRPGGPGGGGVVEEVAISAQAGRRALSRKFEAVEDEGNGSGCRLEDTRSVHRSSSSDHFHFSRTSGTWRSFRFDSHSGASSREHMVWWLCSAGPLGVPCPTGLGVGSIFEVVGPAALLAPSWWPSTSRHVGIGEPSFASSAAMLVVVPCSWESRCRRSNWSLEPSAEK